MSPLHPNFLLLSPPPPRRSRTAGGARPSPTTPGPGDCGCAGEERGGPKRCRHVGSEEASEEEGLGVWVGTESKRQQAPAAALHYPRRPATRPLLARPPPLRGAVVGPGGDVTHCLQINRSRPGALRCALGDRGRVRGRAAPYFVAELAAGPSALPGPCRRGWLRGAVASRRLQQRRWPPAGTRARDDDPHRLLQQLVLSGNLIKEAVRRLQRAVAAVAATSPAGASGPGGSRSGPDPVALQPSGALH
ncbi:GSK-3-binding protein FRAT2 [Ailuropoda melanoleuca]|uniref:GSK-3-binding protein FRAT2 n=1 Tax=Ailuropoda melanoleuca TaxID=9646 RepID=UPI0014946528|nr:GSK-3-binding protein FRAT2 [Ailuropoda melanoleuca]